MGSMSEQQQSGVDGDCAKKSYGCDCGRDHATGFSILDGKSNHSSAGLQHVGTWKREAINEILRQSDAAVVKGVYRIYLRQTPDEQSSGYSKHANGVGFSQFDDKFGSSLGKQIKRNRELGFSFAHCLSPKQITYARKLALKYSRQLTDIANSWEG